jgi:hypothetical protein
VDVRGPEAFAQAHIPGALSLPLMSSPSAWENWTRRIGSSPTEPDRLKSRAPVRRLSC